MPCTRSPPGLTQLRQEKGPLRVPRLAPVRPRARDATRQFSHAETDEPTERSPYAGLGACVPCYEQGGQFTLALDPVAGSVCRQHTLERAAARRDAEAT